MLLVLAGIFLAARPALSLAQRPSPWQSSAGLGVLTGPLTYPRWAIDANGGRLEFAKAPMRIVSLEYEIDEYVYRIAPTERVVGVSAQAHREQVSNVLEHVKRTNRRWRPTSRPFSGSIRIWCWRPAVPTAI
ncbi:MAG: hypothetical protein HC889_10175 [Synechococcaceae cyanobacterium SM1_2_3]|nr:hypothetical protein [Synechococcaceae cyanobacterium SM1_2_3]